ncbi:MAG: CNNM domain-containing protein, partial [Planctomycetota bacterium]
MHPILLRSSIVFLILSIFFPNPNCSTSQAGGLHAPLGVALIALQDEASQENGSEASAKTDASDKNEKSGEPNAPGPDGASGGDSDGSIEPEASDSAAEKSKEKDTYQEGDDTGHGAAGSGETGTGKAWLMLLVAFLLLVANGFFVAAEFALVKVRVSRVEQMVVTKRLFSKSALWLAKRLEKTLSACQLGITMASLALGWFGEPAVAALLEPVFEMVGITSPTVVHTVSFIVGFTIFTALHLVAGEQAPKIFAIRQPETMLLWCALPMQVFYCMTLPLMLALNATTAWILGLFGMKESGEHEVPYTEEEIRALLREAHI